jgi:hypothetical protein
MKRHALFNVVFGLITAALCSVGSFLAVTKTDWTGAVLFVLASGCCVYVALCGLSYLMERM